MGAKPGLQGDSPVYDPSNPHWRCTSRNRATGATIVQHQNRRHRATNKAAVFDSLGIKVGWNTLYISKNHFVIKWGLKHFGLEQIFMVKEQWLQDNWNTAPRMSHAFDWSFLSSAMCCHMCCGLVKLFIYSFLPQTTIKHVHYIKVGVSLKWMRP